VALASDGLEPEPETMRSMMSSQRATATNARTAIEPEGLAAIVAYLAGP
jgi:hypothetical protein